MSFFVWVLPGAGYRSERRRAAMRRPFSCQVPHKL